MMSYLINNQQNLNDVIFANRNKSYGAYAIRSAYGNTVFKSLFIMTVGFGTIMSLAFYFCNRDNDPAEKAGPFIQDSTIVVEYDNTIRENKKIIPETTSSTPEAGKKNPDNSSISIVDSTSTVTQSVEIDHTNTATGNSTLTAVGLPDNGSGLTKGTGSVAATGNTTEVQQPFGVDSQPEFEGGLSALYKFVSKNVKYPAIASEQGKQGIVYVKFVVDEKGKVGNLTLQNNVGYGLDEEALRVVGIIPNFKTPALVKGHAVKVYYQLPIKFRLN